MLKKKWVISFLILVIGLAVGTWIYREYYSDEGYISRAAAAKVLALMMHSKEECLTIGAETGTGQEENDMGETPESAGEQNETPMESDIQNSKMPDVSDEMSLAPYIKTVVADGLMFCDGEYFYPMKMLTYKDLWLICEKTGIDEKKLSFKIRKKAPDEFVLLKHWGEVVDLYNGVTNTLTKKTAILYGTSATMTGLAPWTCETSEGVFGFSGITMDIYINRTIEFYVRDDEIVQILAVLDDNGSENRLNNGNGDDSGNGNENKNEKALGDLASSGAASAGGDVAVSKNSGENSRRADLGRTVRVVLNTDGFKGLIHNGVTVTCDDSFAVIYGESKETYSGGDVIDLVPDDDRFSQGSVHIQALSDDGKVQILSLNRAYGHPAYRGEIVVSLKDGGLVVVNELPIEEYLYGVLPSEMPVSYGLEALKVQAVCARSFVYAALDNAGKFQAYGADVDDSTLSQVYQNSGEDDTACAAVDATRGQVLCANHQIVKTYFFSTSCGVTSDVSDVWGGSAQSYLVPVFQTVSGDSNDLSLEKNFRNFIDLKDNQRYYESDIAWFRWSVTLDSDAVMRGFESVSDGFKEGSIGGDMTGIDILERGKSGIAKKIVIHSENGDGFVFGEYSIRKALCVSGKTILCHDGTEVTNQTMLPSGYFYVDNGGNGQFNIRGGGFGHGVGMSQNGAAAMCRAGMNYEQVLTHFFAGAEIEKR